MVVLLFYVTMESQAIRFVISIVACVESCRDRDPCDEAGVGGGSVGSVTETEHQGHRALLPQQVQVPHILQHEHYILQSVQEGERRNQMSSQSKW